MTSELLWILAVVASLIIWWVIILLSKREHDKYVEERHQEQRKGPCKDHTV